MKRAVVSSSSSSAKFPPSGVFKVYIAAGQATSAPPLGPKLSEANKTWKFNYTKPSIGWYLKQAAGIPRGPRNPKNSKIGWLTAKHILMIAKEKQTDENFSHLKLQSIFTNILYTAKVFGIKVSEKIDMEEFREFCTQRDSLISRENEALIEERAAKYLAKK